MKTYVAGFDLTFAFDVPSSSVSVTQKLYDTLGEQIGADLVIDPSTIASDKLIVSVLAADNAVTAGETKDARLIKLYVVSATGSVSVIELAYAVCVDVPISTMTNSYQTYQGAEMLSIDIPALDGWDAATQDGKQSALIEAFNRIGKLAFDIDGVDVYSINNKTVAEFNLLSSDFILSIRRAQVIEADAALGNDPIASKRQDGLMSETVGESSNMYRPGKPLLISVSRKALNALSGYVKYGAVIGRA